MVEEPSNTPNKNSLLFTDNASKSATWLTLGRAAIFTVVLWGVLGADGVFFSSATTLRSEDRGEGGENSKFHVWLGWRVGYGGIVVVCSEKRDG